MDREAMDGAARQQAAREALFAEQVLAKTGDSVVLKALGGADPAEHWAHYPPGDVFDPDSGAQWYYHSHAPDPAATHRPGEHGHFHCFIRPAGREGPIHHLVALAVDAHGRLCRLFTVNQWVVGDDWLEAGPTVALLPRFDVQLDRPSYLTNRWLSAVVRLYGEEIAGLVAARDRAIAAHRPAPGVATRDDRTLEVTSELAVDLRETARALGV